MHGTLVYLIGSVICMLPVLRAQGKRERVCVCVCVCEGLCVGKVSVCVCEGLCVGKVSVCVCV